MPKLQPLSPTDAAMRLTDLPGWSIAEGMLTKSYETNGWPFTMLVVGAIALTTAKSRTKRASSSTPPSTATATL